MSDDPNKLTGGDYAHKTIKGVLGAIPVAGASASEVFDALVASPVSKRREAWMQDVSERLYKLEQTAEGFSAEDLSENPAFVTTLLNATLIAVRNHQEEKIEALRNAVLNSALAIDVDDSLQATFLDLVDRFNPLHLRLLALLRDPTADENVGAKLSNMTMGSLNQLIEVALPELPANREFMDLIWKDLFDAKLIGTENPHVMMTGPGVLQKRTTTLGDQFLDFISFPDVS